MTPFFKSKETLHTFLPNEPKALSDSDIARLYESLSDYIRNFQK